MAVYLLDKPHIDALTNAAIQYGLLTPEATADQVEAFGQVLWDQNHRCVATQWGEDAPECPTYRFTLADAEFDPYAVLRLIHGYTYQSDETSGWDTSVAHQFCRDLRTLVEATLPADHLLPTLHQGREVPVYQHLRAYTEAPFAITDLTQVPTK